MVLNTLFKKMAYWLLPPGVKQLFCRSKTKTASPLVAQTPDPIFSSLDLSIQAIFDRNEVWRNHHVNDSRCFILASGPSIKSQDLTPLKDEICISVSNWYVHKDYPLIQPRYHCVPFIGGHMQPTLEETVRWLRQMDEMTNQAVMFFSYGDKEVVEQSGLFKNRSVYYIRHSVFDDKDLENIDIDLTHTVLAPQSVSVMALTIAIFMGFKKIYLLGCDHDWILHWGTSAHFYHTSEHVVMSRQGYSEWEGAEDREEDFRAYVSLWKQYKAIRRYIYTKDIKVFNATAGGMLDLFPRVVYESLFKH